MITLPPLVAYLRVSTQNQVDEGYGLDVQQEVVTAWAKANKRRIIAWHRDEGVSGSLDERDGWVDVEDDINSKRAGGVIIPRLDRLARDAFVQEMLMDQIWRLGGEVFSCAADENNLRNDPDDPTRKLIRRILGIINEYEREMILLRMRRGRRLKANRGGYAYGSPEFGKRSVNKQLVKDPTEQATIRRLLDLSRGGASTRQVAAQLNAENRLTKRGRQWTSSGVSDVLRRQATGRHRGREVRT